MGRACKVTVTDIHGVTHAVTVSGATLFEAAASAVALFRREAWAADALTPNAILHVEVQLPPIAHDVPLKALARWIDSPSTNPREQVVKRTARDPARR